MKKFLVFLVSIVMVVSFGLVTFYFLRNDETINFKTNEVYCNVGDTITVSDLGKTVKKPSKNTTYNYNAADEAVLSAIKFDTDKGYYVASKGGEYEVVITTSNKKFSKFTITVHIGDGSEESPYYIENEQGLNKIGNIYAANAHYVLTSDIILSNEFTTIGKNQEGAAIGFSGSFDGGYHTITGSEYSLANEYVGLFSKLNSGAKVQNLNLKDFKINLSKVENVDAIYAGVLAGAAENVEISSVQVYNSSINACENAVIGGLIGEVKANTSSISMCSANNFTVTDTNCENETELVIGGLIGNANLTSIKASYATGNFATTNRGKLGGLVGELTISATSGSVQQSYAAVTGAEAGFIDTITETGDMSTTKYIKYLVGNYSVSADDVALKNAPAGITDLLGLNAGLESKGIYVVDNYTDAATMLADCPYVFYEVKGEKQLWDNYIWNISSNNLPVLKKTSVTPSVVGASYLNKNLEEVAVSANEFIEFIEKCKAENGQILNKSFVLSEDVDLEALGYTWSSIDMTGSTFDGNGHSIKNLTLKTTSSGNLSFFGSIKSSSISNIKFENVKFEADATNAAVLANSIDSLDAEISNVTINFAEPIKNKYTRFSGLASMASGIIKNCTIENLEIGEDAVIEDVAGLVNQVNAGADLQGNKITATLRGQLSISGVAKVNGGKILGTTAEITIPHSSAKSSTIAGVVNTNNGTIDDADLTINFAVKAASNETKLAGVAIENNNSIKNTTIKGAGIKVEDENCDGLSIAGVAIDNKGTIESVKVVADQIGSYIQGKNHKVAGFAINNSTENSVISTSAVTSRISGNWVAGAVIEMNHASAKIDKIIIGAYNAADNTMAQNTIEGDKYVAGVAISLKNGAISNVQASSLIYGEANATVSSPMLLIFPNNASFINATINSTFDGYGKRYAECWQDFRLASNQAKADFGYESIKDQRFFDLLDRNYSAGKMQSVVINKTALDANSKTDYTRAKFIEKIWPWGWAGSITYENNNDSSYFTYVGAAAFNKGSTYKGKMTLTSTVEVYGNTITYEKNCLFDFNSIWEEVNGNGIRLKALADLFA